MTTTRILRLLPAAALAACLGAAPAFAAAVSFVSVKGVDSGTCASPTAPCRTFAYAYGQTSAGGDILAVDPGDYGSVSIFKSISITGVPGAGIVGGDIFVSAASTDTVNLFGLTLERSSSFDLGFNNGAKVTIKNCAVRNPTYGISIKSAGGLLIEDVSISNISSASGITIARDVAAVSVINRVSSVASPTRAAVSSSSSGTTIADSVLADSETGLNARGNVFVTRTTISGNAVEGISGDGVNSAGDNFIRGNTVDVNGSLTNVGLQ